VGDMSLSQGDGGSATVMGATMKSNAKSQAAAWMRLRRQPRDAVALRAQLMVAVHNSW